MAKGLDDIAALPDPVGAVIERMEAAQRPRASARVRVPIGIIGVIYEARPNVTADAGALCMQVGQRACMLRGGSDSFHSSSRTIVELLLARAGLARRTCPRIAIAAGADDGSRGGGRDAARHGLSRST
jgi:glutamate-5-semialdehyde dehydrogenase